MIIITREGGGCAARLACKLGEMGREAPDGQVIVVFYNYNNAIKITISNRCI